MEIDEINIQKICRACKSVEENMYSVFENKVTFDQSTKISEMLMACTSLEVQMDDGMPNLMCFPCIEQLNIAFTFKRQCEDTDLYLREYIKKNEIKFENSEDDVNVIFDNMDSKSIKDEYLDQDTEIFVCKECDKKFINLKSLNLHIKRYHTSDSESSKCNLCLEDFPSLILLKEHVEITHSKKVYACKICKKNIFAYSQLKRHLISHLKEKSFTCTICNRHFSRMDQLTIHMEKCKDREWLYTCTICDERFSRAENLQLHMVEMHEEKDNLQVLDSIENYLEHYIELENDDTVENFEDFDECFEPNIDIVENEIKYENDEIKYEFDEKLEENLPLENYGIEEEIVTEEATTIKRKRGRPRKGEERFPTKGKKQKPVNFPCNHCDKVLKTKLGFDIHLQKHCKDSIYECGKCGEKFNDNELIFKHIEEQHINDDTIEENGERMCDLCEETFDHFEKLVKHKLNKHNIRVKMLTDKKYDCYVCGKGFTTEKYRDIHEKTHSMEKSCTCKTCGKRFTTKTNLNEHMKCHNECSKKFLCSECGQRFIRYDYLVIHMRRHRGEKPFKCKYCGKGFPRTTDLTVHERYHTGEKTHLCVICGRGFGRAYNLTVHMRTHTGEKPYQCTYCDAAFAQGNDLKAHVRRHTGERYHCDICSEAFLMGYLLTQHKRNVHGLDVKSHIRRLKPSERVHLTTQIPNAQAVVVGVMTAAATTPDDTTTSEAQQFQLTYQNQVL